MNFNGSYSVLNQYQGAVDTASSTYGVPSQILNALIWTESSGDASAVGPPIDKLGGETAKGLLQFIPSTAAQYNVNPLDPVSSIRGAAQYLANLYKRYGNWQDAVAAYKGNANSTEAQGYASETMSVAQKFGMESGGGKTEATGIKGVLENMLSSVASAPVLGGILAPAIGALGQSGILGQGTSNTIKELQGSATKAASGLAGKTLDEIWAWLQPRIVVLATVLLAVALGYLGVKAASTNE